MGDSDSSCPTAHHFNYSYCDVQYYDHDDGTQNLVSLAHLVASTVSAACCLAVLFASRMHDQLRSFPKSMLLWKTFCDLVTALCVVGTNGVLYARDVCGHTLCQSGVLAWLMGFSLFASPAWFFALAFNLNRSLHDPFTRPQARLKKFHTYVWSSSILVGSIVTIFRQYRPNLHICWSCPGSHDLLSWVLLFGWIIAFWIMAIAILLDAWYRLVYTRRSGHLIQERLASRVPQLRESATYVFIIGAHWTITAVSFVIIFNDHEDESMLKLSPLGLRIAFAVALGLLGPIDALCWCSSSMNTFRELVWLQAIGKADVEASIGPSSEGEAADKRASRRGSGKPESGRTPLWHAIERREINAIKRQAKKRRAKEREAGDISDLLRREFVHCTIAGIEASMRLTDEKRNLSEEEAGGPRSRQSSGRNGTRAVAAMEVEMQSQDAEVGVAARSRTPSNKDHMLPPEALQREWRYSEVQELQLAPAIFFAELAPRVFETMRVEVFGTSNQDYLAALCGDNSPPDGERGSTSEAEPSLPTSQSVVDRMVLSFSEGKGGGFFFWSLDRRFLVKTLEPNEHSALVRILHKYYCHMFTRRGSLLPRFYGSYSITIQNHTKHFVVMESIFFGAPQGKVHEIYDLKGSWIDRHSELQEAGKGTYKDMDLHNPLRLPHAKAEEMLEELRHDSELLCSANIMDYSLLLGVHNVPVATSQLSLEREAVDIFPEAIDVPRYYMGVIDVFQEWNFGKRLERWTKIILKGRWAKGVRDGMSAIEPLTYKGRFLAGMSYQLGLRDYQTDGHQRV